MLGHSVAYYFPEFWATTPLYAEKIIPLLDHMLSVSSPQANRLALLYFDVFQKYKNPSDMTDASVRRYIQDMGYGYILDLISLSGESLRNLLFLLPIIDYLKNSKAGLELVLQILSVDGNGIGTEVIEWWEQNPVGVEDTFKIVSTIDVSNINPDFFEKFDIFIKKYVWPTLTDLSLAYSVSGGYALLPIVTIKVEADLLGTMAV